MLFFVLLVHTTNVEDIKKSPKKTDGDAFLCTKDYISPPKSSLPLLTTCAHGRFLFWFLFSSLVLRFVRGYDSKQIIACTVLTRILRKNETLKVRTLKPPYHSVEQRHIIITQLLHNVVSCEWESDYDRSHNEKRHNNHQLHHNSSQHWPQLQRL